ncbi:MAG TPA: hypothetical protein VF557_20465 [Jatrophihabitans sp.]|uniref:hypothetical protein n=1 Tax=Jatrophihabitans sp. TaxID=1932789 RepID=UPI002EF30E19
MSARALLPPSGGDAAPLSAVLADGQPLDLVVLATEICRRYREEFPDEEQRYAAAGNAWCVHDNQHLLSWAVEAVNDESDMRDDVAWLASVLESRGFPVERLARNLDLAGDLAGERIAGQGSDRVSGVLRDAAEFVRSYGSFRDWVLVT